MSSDVAELDRDVDALPDGWHSLRLGDVADISRGTSWGSDNERREPVDGALPVLGIRNVQARLEIDDLLWLHGLKPSAIASSTVQTGDILMVGSNGNPARIGNAVQVDEPGRYLYASLLFGLRPRREAVDPDFLYFAIIARGVQTAISDAVQGTTGLSNLKITTLRDLPIDLPPLDEQRRIAEVLRSVDEAIAAKQATLAASKLFKRTCREAAIARCQHHAPSRLQSVLASIDAGWSPDCETEPAGDGEWSILKTSAVVWEGYNDEENKRLPAHLEPRPHLEVVADDILITRAGPAERTGVIAIVRETAGRRMLSDKIIRLRVDREKAVPRAIAELLSSEHVQAEMIRSKSGMAASQTNISQKIVLGLEMHLPPLNEQQDFAEEMAALQDAIETGEADLQTTRELKAALMSDLLSGHVRVPA